MRITSEALLARRRKLIWFDLDNSPHVPFFKPIIEQLQARGYPVLVTARDCFQVRELTELLKVHSRIIGRHYGKNRLMKLVGTGIRALKLLPHLRNRPVLAVSHGSRSQLVASKLLNVPNLQICDYEFAKIWFLISPRWFMSPSVIPADAINCDRARLLTYPGIKEDVYVPSFVPNAATRRSLGISTSDILVIMRPPATEAHYHNPESEILFHASLERVSADQATRIIMLPRNHRQADLIRATWPEHCATGKVIIPKHVVNGLDLVWASDMVISGGGTMNREAAALGVPVYSVFRGRIGAVDNYLVSKNRLTLLRSIEDVRSKLRIEHRSRQAGQVASSRPALPNIVEQIVAIVEETC